MIAFLVVGLVLLLVVAAFAWAGMALRRRPPDPAPLESGSPRDAIQRAIERREIR